jgi:hypothetical protein
LARRLSIPHTYLSVASCWEEAEGVRLI